MLDEHDALALSEFCNVLHPATTAEVLEGLDGEKIWEVLGHSSLERQVEVFEYLSPAKQIEMVDEIAFPEKAKPEMQAGVSFFNTMRDLTACGFFTSKMGWADLGYMGNRPNQWNGVPQDVLEQYGLEYDARTLEISVNLDS